MSRSYTLDRGIIIREANREPAMIDPQYHTLATQIKVWGEEAGFQQIGITDTHLEEHEAHLNNWLAKDYAGEMNYLSEHGIKRSRPEELIPGTTRVICFRLDYLTNNARPADIIATDHEAYIARYSLGRDYHKVLRQKLKRIWQKTEQYLEDQSMPPAQGRVFTDSAPVLEKALAEKAGLGWIGKNTLLLNRNAGSWFFLGEIYTNLPLPLDEATADQHCGSCSACIDVCPTDAIVGPFELDARKCISYLTIEHRGPIPLELRAPMGNRIFGCDDCQVFCPWNKFAQFTTEPDFAPRHGLEQIELLALFSWTEEQFLQRTEGSAIRRTGYEGWQRNIAIALGNAGYGAEIVMVLSAAKESASELVKEHIQWALDEQHKKAVALP
jgi:epoxyqueuosine reductase